MNIEETATKIFNLFWLSSIRINRSLAIKLSVIHVNGLIKALGILENDFITKQNIDDYKKVKETIENFSKK